MSEIEGNKTETGRTDGTGASRATRGLFGRLSGNQRVFAICGAIVFGMVGLSYAAVPLYDMFCRVTGFGGTTQQATGVVGEVLDREVTVFFDANTAPGLDWSFEPLQRSQRIKLGENGLAFYEVTNVSDRPLIGTATYNVTPNKTGVFFAKIECFCFTEQRLEPGESMQMPVSYFVDPRLDEERNLDDVTQITLSYTFFKVGEGEQETAALAE